LRSSPNPGAALLQSKLIGRFWGCFAAQRGASPLTTESPLATKSPLAPTRLFAKPHQESL
ncbi:hypothetical protein, partial [Pseudomonas allii]|uniref:hypothetical protein n=1 Tax=Pseudomonas allii TaxID=2740531 RepID=UPI001963E3E0